MDVPLVSLANHEALRIEELEMAFKANIRNVTLKDMDELDALASKKGRIFPEMKKADRRYFPSDFPIPTEKAEP